MCFGNEKSSGKIRKHVKSNWQQFWAKKTFENFLRFLRSKISKLCHFICSKMDLCRGMLNKKRVLASKSHRGKQENMWKQFGNNFEQKKILKFLRSEISKVRHFICPKNGFPPTSRWCKKFLGVLWRQTKISMKPET